MPDYIAARRATNPDRSDNSSAPVTAGGFKSRPADTALRDAAGHLARSPAVQRVERAAAMLSAGKAAHLPIQRRRINPGGSGEVETETLSLKQLEALKSQHPGSAGEIQAAIDAFDFRHTPGDQRNQIAELARNILEKYPPESHHYVGLGRSPTPLMAYLHAMAVDDKRISSSNLPLSKFSPSGPSFLGRQEENMKPHLSGEESDRLKDHFDNFVPSAEALGGRNVLMMDFVTSGRSLLAGQKHLQHYLNKRDGSLLRSGPAVKSLALTSNEVMAPTRDRMAAIGVTEPPMAVGGQLGNTDSLAGAMGAEKFKDFAQYGSYDVTKAGNADSAALRAKPSEDYVELVKHFHGHLHGTIPDPADYEEIGD